MGYRLEDVKSQWGAAPRKRIVDSEGKVVQTWGADPEQVFAQIQKAQDKKQHLGIRGTARTSETRRGSRNNRKNG